MNHRKKNIIQFTPYYPPHVGGVEKVCQDIHENWSHGKSIVVTPDIGISQAGYNENIILLPYIDVISNFPFPKFWSPLFWRQLKKVNSILKNESYFCITHTRFFIPSFIGGLIAKRTKSKWIHIEHGSDFVKLSSTLKNVIARAYDHTLGKYVILQADSILCISKTVEKFIKKEFKRQDTHVWYRGIVFPDTQKDVQYLKQKYENKIIIGVLSRLVAWKNIDALCEAVLRMQKDSKVGKKIICIIIGDGEEKSFLQERYTSESIIFLGTKSAAEAFSLQSEFDYYVHPSKPGGGLSTSLLQAIHLGIPVVATQNEGADEVINGDNGVLLSNDSTESLQAGIKEIIKKGVQQKRSQKYDFEVNTSLLKLYELI